MIAFILLIIWIHLVLFYELTYDIERRWAMTDSELIEEGMFNDDMIRFNYGGKALTMTYEQKMAFDELDRNHKRDYIRWSTIKHGVKPEMIEEGERV